ncbi:MULTISPECIES: hypothetical protein [Lentzea]|nr:hypothetical protein [Lentzea atacamensis]
MFSPLQLRPRTLLGLVSPCLARWLAEYVTTFPAMVETYRSAVVVSSLRIDYATPYLRFTDAPWLTVRSGLRIDQRGEWLQVDIDCVADDRSVARVTATMRVLTVTDASSLAASPGVLHPDLLKRFTPAETMTAVPPPHSRPTLPAPVLAPQHWQTFISRSHAEVADQWSFVEMVELATQARERLYVENLHDPLPSCHVVGTPTQILRAVFLRPMFVYDPCQVISSAHLDPDTSTLCFRHQIGHPSAPRPHLTVWETLDVAG